MKKLIITAAALMVAAAAAYGQGQFLFNTHDLSAGNNVTFLINGAPATGSDLFVQVLAGPDASSLKPVTGTTVPGPLPLNRAGAGAGYTNPFSDIYTVAGMAGGTKATVAYQAFKGTALTGATATSAMQIVPTQVTLTEPPTPPNEVALGTNLGVVIVPEPGTLALGLIGLGSLLAIRRRK